MTWFRITTEKKMARMMREPTSCVWAGTKMTECPDCDGRGEVDGERCARCRGTGEIEDIRRGVSCCATVEDLAAYFAGRSATIVAGMVMVEIDGELSDDEDHDAGDDGDPVLVIPSRIVAVTPVPEAVLAAIRGE